MFVKAKSDTVVYVAKDNGTVLLSPVKAGEVVETTLFNYKQYAMSSNFELLSTVCNNTGVWYIGEFLKDSKVYNKGSVISKKKGETEMFTEMEFTSYMKMGIVKGGIVKKKKEEKEVVSDVVEVVQEEATKKTVSKSKKK